MRTFTSLLVLAFVGLFFITSNAEADEDCAFVTKTGCGREKETVTYGGSGGDSSVGDSQGRSGSPNHVRREPEMCLDSEGSTVPCNLANRIWHQERRCYMKPESPQPPKGDPVWRGSTDGVIMMCATYDSPANTCAAYNSSGVGGHCSRVWAPSAEVAPPDPEELAWEAVASMDLEAIQLGTFPDSIETSADSLGYVGWNVWLWAKDPKENTYGPITRSASDRGYSVTGTGRVSHIEWDMGNGDTVTCDAGTAWTDAVRNEASPDCGYVYTHEGDYTITATSYWVVEWEGLGQRGTIEVDVARSATVRIAEAQVVVVDVGDA